VRVRSAEVKKEEEEEEEGFEQNEIKEK